MTNLTTLPILVRTLQSEPCLFQTDSLVDAEKPEEWDDEEDGDWIAPTVRNPKCDSAPGCGEWKR